MRAVLKLCLRLARDRWTRARLAGGGAEGRILLGSTWDFPNPNHAFAYQEMIGLRDLGLDVRVYHGDPRPSRGVAARFAPLLRRSFVVETAPSIHARDLRHLDQHRPGKVDAFLRRVAVATGRTVEGLRRDPMIGRAATFTRLCELARARYLQSWFFYDLSFMAMFAAQVLGIPRGISCHVDHELDDHPWKLVPLQLATADLVLAISDRTREELLRRGMLDLAGRLLVKRVGVDATSLRPLRGRRFDRPATADKPFELVSVCRIEPKKGLLTLVDACDLLRARGRAVRVRLVGGADPGNPTSAAYAAELRGRIAGRSLSNVVVEAGAIGNDGIPAALASADAFVAPYVELDSGDKDGIPTAVLEAMAAGLPIVGTSAGAMREAVADGREGILVPQRDAGALAGAIEALAADPAARSRLGVGAAARFDAEFDCRVTERELHARVRALLARGIVS